MAELTDREKAIIHEMTFMFNPSTVSVPIDLRVLALQTMLKIRKINFTIQELKDISFAIENEQKSAISESFGFLNKHKELMSGLDHLKF